MCEIRLSFPDSFSSEATPPRGSGCNSRYPGLVIDRKTGTRGEMVVVVAMPYNKN